MIDFIFMLPEGRANSRHFVCPSVCLLFRPSFCPSVLSKPFLPNPWTKLDETSYMNSLDIAPMYFSRTFNLTLCLGKRGLNAKFQSLLIFFFLTHSFFKLTLCNEKKGVSCKILYFYYYNTCI